MDIAVFLDENDNVISFNSSGTVRLYSKVDRNWNIKKEVSFSIDSTMGIGSIRDSIKNMVLKLDDCKVFAAEDVTGITYNILESMDFNIWRVSGKPVDFLDYIEQNELKELQEKKIPETIPKPIEKEEGYYFIDLREVMEHNEKVTTKQVLLPFFHKKLFCYLDIMCSHIPPWFNNELPKLGFKFTTNKLSENSFLVKVINKYEKRITNCKL
ncbi:Fe-only nitrogenase accessory protein AnfO [Clostridium oryzae]|uniref:Iron only nitrogenase protein AnfO n=1 Tax=Clostridium oryzae TaxID=1450648 RepID=A0A1V4IPQ9_9CLOT|nr:Fe-only nitrogenase accessory protein AnfO [Clostridium oryzae]OPJ61906.1 iron only nitrogenase protein AnfO [Clostridium oryzae]